MVKKLLMILTVVFLLLTMSNVCFADENVLNYEKESFREEIELVEPSITPREATISMLLNAGWSKEEIEEWYTEDMLVELDGSALAVSNNAQYTVYYEDEKTKETVSGELSRQEFDYGVNQVRCAEEDHNNTEVRAISSNGVLELQPIYGWEDMNHITDNSRRYDGLQGYSGASIYNADSGCYIKQNMGLVWMGDDDYTVQYRFEWVTEPLNKLNDKIGVALATDLLVHTEPREYFIFKYYLPGSGEMESSEVINWKVSGSYPASDHCSIKALSFGQGRQLSIEWPYNVSTHSKANDAKGFFTFHAKVNDKSQTLEEFLVYAQYYHGKVGCNADANVGASIAGANASFSISPSFAYSVENHPMEVRARNIYYAG